MRKKYVSPEIETYNHDTLARMIEGGACSANFSCHCHSGNNNTARMGEF